MTLVELACSKTKVLQCGSSVGSISLQLIVEINGNLFISTKNSGDQFCSVVSAGHFVSTQSRLYLGLVLTSDTTYVTLLPQFDYSRSTFSWGMGEGIRGTAQCKLPLSCHMQGFTGAFFLLSMCSVAESQKW